MVADHDGGSAGLPGLQSAPDGHDALDDERLTRHFCNFGQLLYGLAAGGGIHALQEGQAGGVDVHGHGEAAGGLDLLHLPGDGLLIPGLHGGHAHTVLSGDGLAGDLHDVGIQTVTGEGGNAVFGAGLDEDVVVGHIVIFVGIVHGHRAHRAGKERKAEGLPEKLERGVGGAALTDGVHVDADFLPLVVVADGGVAYALGTGTGDVVAAGSAVAHGAGLAVLAQSFPGAAENFLIGHWCFLLYR